MGDIAWVRKYRPSSFDDYMGENVKNMVINRFKDRNNIPNTIMLSGTRGTGKTSMARLIAKEVHCMNPIDGHSCGECEMCQEIDSYITSTEAGVECAGITEVDAATTTGKNDINDIIEDAMIPPMYPLEHKILIMDECHMLSVSAQNSLLKVVEEPPPHLIFIFCTTDPDKVIPTIRSRMQMRVEVRKKTIDEMAEKLNKISQLEGLETSTEALQIIAKRGDRIPRDCINLLEEVAKTYNNRVTIDTVRKATGDISTGIYIDFYSAANSSIEHILQFNNKIKQNDIAPKQFISGLIRFTLDCMYIRYGINLEDFPVEFIEPAKKLFAIYKSKDMDTLLQIIERASSELTDDDNKNELVITTTALRIGKVQMLAKGLASEKYKSEAENKKSVTEYRKHLEETAQSNIEKLPDISPAREAFANILTNMRDVADTKGIISEIRENNKPATESKSDDGTFFSPDELAGMFGS